MVNILRTLCSYNCYIFIAVGKLLHQHLNKKQLDKAEEAEQFRSGESECLHFLSIFYPASHSQSCIFLGIVWVY